MRTRDIQIELPPEHFKRISMNDIRAILVSEWINGMDTALWTFNCHYPPNTVPGIGKGFLTSSSYTFKVEQSYKFELHKAKTREAIDLGYKDLSELAQAIQGKSYRAIIRFTLNK